MSLLFRENDPLARLGESRPQAFSPGEILLGQMEAKNPPASGREPGNGWFSLSAPVGRDYAPNRKSDVAKVETLLGQTGHYDIQRLQGPTGYWGMVGDKAVKDFQKQNGLKADGLLNPDGPTNVSLKSRVEDIFKDYTPPTVDQIDAHHRALAENGVGLLTFGRPPLRMVGAGQVAPEIQAANRRTLQYLSGYGDNQGLDQAAARDIASGDETAVPRYRDLIWQMSQNDPRRAHAFAWGILDHLPDARRRQDFLGFEAPASRPVGIRRNEWDGRRTMELRPEDVRNEAPPRAEPYYPDKDESKNILLKVEDGEEGRKKSGGSGDGTDGADAPLDLRDDQADPKDDGGHDSGSPPSEDASADGQAQQNDQGQSGGAADSDSNRDGIPQPTDEPKTGEEKQDGFGADKINSIDDKDRANILGKAKGWEGTEYAPADSEYRGPNATKKVGADCSGSIHAIYKEAGLGYKYKSSSEFAGAARRGEIPFKEVPAKDSKPGDIVLWPGKHMSINQGNGNVIGAYRQGRDFASSPQSELTRHFRQEPIYFTRTR